LIGNCFYKGKIKAACGPGLDGVQIFTAADFIAASVEHIPPKGQQCPAA
jgi:hypothetical protein